ncbi:ankyrin repeat-containing protein NPR4-like [Rutidosis leptorrhynchoides]|uniref:ankyrin repeat-containing protein NPR4-like n=1 Tax=Rutidosis leptorrhynchoides TaxID=125765 RepID=UPI003A9A2AA8
MIPPSYRERQNKDDLTPHVLFTKEHKDLVAQGEKWMEGTASQCMVVVALIAPIVCTAAFTVPGGYKQSNDKDNGIPVFHSKATFLIFVIADAISLFTSAASILMFLSILTSRYVERDFLETLPKKLMLGLLTLFLSITNMTIAFSVSLFVLYKSGLVWVPLVLSLLAVMLVFLFAWLQYPLLAYAAIGWNLGCQIDFACCRGFSHRVHDDDLPVGDPVSQPEWERAFADGVFIVAAREVFWFDVLFGNGF